MKFKPIDWQMLWLFQFFRSFSPVGYVEYLRLNWEHAAKSPSQYFPSGDFDVERYPK